MNLFDTVPGRALTPGTISIPASEIAELAVVLGSEAPSDGSLHPLHAYIASQRGIGVTIPELCAIAEFDVNDGPMLGSLELDLVHPMKPDVE